MTVLLYVAGAYLLYVVMGAIVSLVLIARTIRRDELASRAELDLELRELITQEPVGVS